MHHQLAIITAIMVVEEQLILWLLPTIIIILTEILIIIREMRAMAIRHHNTEAIHPKIT